MRMDVNGDGSLTKREMLAADEFTPEEVRQGGREGTGTGSPGLTQILL